MKRIIKSTEDIFAMSNVRGKYVKNPHSLPFSFYFSSGTGVSHGPRVKPMFNESKLISSLTGTLKLCDDWNFVPGINDKDVKADKISDMKDFFRNNIVLFCAVWDEQMQDATLEDYFKGDITFQEMIADLDFYEKYRDDLVKISNVSQLDEFCRKNQLVNFYGN